MPIYEYECTGCHHKFDVLQKLNDEHTKTCPACNHDTAIRLVSAAGFQLKGSGWYATDFKNKGKPEPKADSKAEATDSSSNEKKSTESVTPSTPTKGESD